MICFQCNEDKSLDCYTKRARARPASPRKRCKDCEAENARISYARNPEPRKAAAKRWRDKNPPAYQARKKVGWKIHRARKLDAFVEAVDPVTVYNMHGGQCGICKKFVSFAEFEVDHIIPLARGGLEAYINCQPAHQFCNRSKGFKTEEELLSLP